MSNTHITKEQRRVATRGCLNEKLHGANEVFTLIGNYEGAAGGRRNIRIVEFLEGLKRVGCPIPLLTYDHKGTMNLFYPVGLYSNGILEQALQRVDSIYDLQWNRESIGYTEGSILEGYTCGSDGDEMGISIYLRNDLTPQLNRFRRAEGAIEVAQYIGFNTFVNGSGIKFDTHIDKDVLPDASAAEGITT